WRAVAGHNFWEWAKESRTALPIGEDFSRSHLQETGWVRVDPSLMRGIVKTEKINPELIRDRYGREKIVTESIGGQGWYMEPNTYRALEGFLERDRVKENLLLNGLLQMSMLDKSLFLMLPAFHALTETRLAMNEQLWSGFAGTTRELAAMTSQAF